MSNTTRAASFTPGTKSRAAQTGSGLLFPTSWAIRSDMLAYTLSSTNASTSGASATASAAAAAPIDTPSTPTLLGGTPRPSRKSMAPSTSCRSWSPPDILSPSELPCPRRSNIRTLKPRSVSMAASSSASFVLRTLSTPWTNTTVGPPRSRSRYHPLRVSPSVRDVNSTSSYGRL